MARIEVTKIEERLEHGLVYNVRVWAAGRRYDLPMDIHDEELESLNEYAVLLATLEFARELATSARLRLRPRRA